MLLILFFIVTLGYDMSGFIKYLNLIHNNHSKHNKANNFFIGIPIYIFFSIGDMGVEKGSLFVVVRPTVIHVFVCGRCLCSNYYIACIIHYETLF